MNNYNFVNRLTLHSDDWGFGQIGIEKIRKMIKVGEKFGVTFTLAKIVTGMCDETGKEKTIIASNDYFFVFPSEHKDFSEFWKDVEEKEEKEK